jgi:hypothetical protein
MCSIPPLGALNKITREYIYPGIATKADKYVCPDCDKDLVLKKGTIRVHHFAHAKSDNPCSYYDKPSEAQIHKDAKMLLKKVLDSKRQLVIYWHCTSGDCQEDSDEYEIPIISDTSVIKIEHRFNHNGLKIADVAYLDNNEIVCLFEILNTHKTASDARPEPWFEIDAHEFINEVNNSTGEVVVQCMRDKTCDSCKSVSCIRCKYMSPRWLMHTNIKKDLCKLCDLEWWNKIHLEVPYSDKDKVKAYGGRFDAFYKKWYICDDNKQKTNILKWWKEYIPTSPN